MGIAAQGGSTMSATLAPAAMAPKTVSPPLKTLPLPSPPASADTWAAALGLTVLIVFGLLGFVYANNGVLRAVVTLSALKDFDRWMTWQEDQLRWWGPTPYSAPDRPESDL